MVKRIDVVVLVETDCHHSGESCIVATFLDDREGAERYADSLRSRHGAETEDGPEPVVRVVRQGFVPEEEGS